jgi:hypothetical protein
MLYNFGPVEGRTNIIQRFCEFRERFSQGMWKMFSVFICLQLLDALTTVVGLSLGANEGSIFVARLLQFGPIVGLIISKTFSVMLVMIAVAANRGRVVRFVNFWFVAVVAWNLVIIGAVRV